MYILILFYIRKIKLYKKIIYYHFKNIDNINIL